MTARIHLQCIEVSCTNIDNNTNLVKALGRLQVSIARAHVISRH